MGGLLGGDKSEERSGKEKAKGRAREAAGAVTGDEGAKEKGKKEQGKKQKKDEGLGGLLK